MRIEVNSTSKTMLITVALPSVKVPACALTEAGTPGTTVNKRQEESEVQRS